MTWRRYAVEWDPSTERDLKRLDAALIDRFIKAVYAYAETGHGNVKQLQGAERGRLRLRVGDWRVLFAIDASRHVMVISRVSPRGGAYK